MINNELYVDDFKIQLNASIGRGQYGEVFDCKWIKNPYLSLCAKIISAKVPKKYQDIEKRISQLVSQNKENENLVTIYHIKELTLQSKLIIIMEKCESNLQKLINQNKIFNDFEMTDFILQFLQGYQVLYYNDIIHRDIKPENILINTNSRQNTYKLADFGTGKIYKANDFFITKIGTPAYTAPEINSLIRDGELDEHFKIIKPYPHSKSQVDIFSLGIILYQMVYGKLPFEQTRDGIIEFAKTIKQSPFKLTGKSQYKEIIEEMLQYYPDQRMSFQFLYNFVQEKKNTKITCPIQYSQKNTKVSISLPSINKNGFNQNGVIQNGFNQNGVILNGVNQNGVILNGFNQNGVNQNGVILNGFNQNGVIQNGVNQNGVILNAFNNGVNQNGVIQNGVNQNGVIQNGVNQNGVIQNGVNQNGVNQNGVILNGVILNGVNQNGVNQNGVNQNGVILNGFNQNGVIQNGVNKNAVNQQFQLQNNFIPNNKIQIHQLQTPCQPCQQEAQPLISPHQKIKEYLEFLLNDHGDIIKDDAKNLIQYLIQNSTFSIDQLKQLLALYKNKIQKPDLCESRTLIFFYCILSILNNTALLNIQSFDDKKLREEIKLLYDTLNPTWLQQM